MIHLVLLPNVIFLFLNISKGCCGGTIFEEWGHIFKGKTSALVKGKPELEYLLVVSDLGQAAHSFLVFSFPIYKDKEDNIFQGSFRIQKVTVRNKSRLPPLPNS